MPTNRLHLERARKQLTDFNWADLFVEELGWGQPPVGVQPLAVQEASDVHTLKPVARLGGAWVYTVSSSAGFIPGQQAREALHRNVVSRQREHLLLFEDAERRQVLWSWPRYEGNKLTARTHLYVRGQPADLFLTKLSGIYFDLAELDARGEADLFTVTERLKKALDTRPVTRKFYQAFSQQQQHVANMLDMPDKASRRHYASVLVTRLMFVYFLQKKFLLDNRNDDYLQQKLNEHQAWAVKQTKPVPTFYRHFLQPLFFQGFALRPEHRDPDVASRLGTIPYLNGGLFLPHALERAHPDLDLPDEATAQLLGIFTQFTWNLDDRDGADTREINPDVLGYIFEKYINSNSSLQKDAGAFYTPPEITTYLCDQTVDGLLLRACNEPIEQTMVAGLKPYHFRSIDELLLRLDDHLARKLILALRELTLLDPACGSGAFLVAALQKLESVYAVLVGYVEVKAADPWLHSWLHGAQEHPSLTYFIRKEIITRNLFGVDLMDEAVEIARLRLFLALVAAAKEPKDLEPLPNIDFNLMEGNALVGLLHIQEGDFDRYAQPTLFAPSYQDLLREKNLLIDRYKGLGPADQEPADTEMGLLRTTIEERLASARSHLDQLLVDQYKTVAFQQAHWNPTKKKETYTKTRLTPTHIHSLRPFHWGYEFERVLRSERGGFDAIIANPPWEAFKPNAKEFFEEYDELVQKKNMRVEDFEQKKAELLEDLDLREAWEAYLSRFPFVSELFRASPDYRAQTSEVDGKRTSSDVNLYKLFLERSFRLLRPGGAGGIIVPTGLYTDLGAKGLRELLFNEAEVVALFGLSNERKLFEDVHHAFKYAIVVFVKGGHTRDFAAAFRIQPREAIGRDDLDRLLRDPAQQVRISVKTVRQLSPDSHSVPEFRTTLDQHILEKLAAHPGLGQEIPNAPWQLRFGREFDMTNDSDLFQPEPALGRIPLFEGKMMHQFRADFAEPRYWVDAIAGRERVLGRTADAGQTLPYQLYRLAYRAIARSSDTRTLIVAMLPANVFCGHSLNVDRSEMRPENALYLLALMNSFVLDYRLRLSVSANLTMFFLYQLPIPRLPPTDPRFKLLVRRAAQLVCTTPAFDELARMVGLPGYHELTDTERNRLRAEIDGLVATLYNLTTEELDHILTTFPLVPEPTLVAVRNAFRDASRNLIK